MKRVISILVLCAVFCSLLAGCGSKQDDTSTPETSSQPQGPASALEALEAIWGRFSEDEKFWIVGGDYNHAVENAPGNVDLTVTDYLTVSLLVPDGQLAAISEAASMMHAMNGNNFTCGVFKVADVNGFADAMKDAVLSNMWVCGMPETLEIMNLGGGYVLVAFGIDDAMDPFFAKLEEAHPHAVELVEEPIV